MKLSVDRSLAPVVCEKRRSFSPAPADRRSPSTRSRATSPDAYRSMARFVSSQDGSRPLPATQSAAIACPAGHVRIYNDRAREPVYRKLSDECQRCG
jgi:hypothetical protein